MEDLPHNEEATFQRAVYGAVGALPAGWLREALVDRSYGELRALAFGVTGLAVWGLAATVWAVTASVTGASRADLVQPAELGVIAGQAAGDTFRAQARAQRAERALAAETFAREQCEASWEDLVDRHAETRERYVGLSRVLNVRPGEDGAP